MSTFELRKACTFCREVGVPHFGPSPLLCCGTCRLAYYCSEDCQRKHWNSAHKEVHQKYTDKQLSDIRTGEDPCFHPDKLEPLDGFIPLEYPSVGDALFNLSHLAFNLANKAIFTLDESSKSRLRGLAGNFKNICNKLDSVSKLEKEWRKLSNCLSTMEVLYHYPLNSVFRFGNGLYPWWESYIVSFGRVKQAVDFLASLGDSGIFHNGNFPVIVVKLVLPEAVVDKRGNPMLVVKEAKAKTVDEKDRITCYNCAHQITGKLRPPFDPKDVANFHDEALVYPLQRPVNLMKVLSSHQVQTKILTLGDAVPVFCNYVCDMTVKIQEVGKLTQKPACHVIPGPDILQTRHSQFVSSMVIQIMQNGSSRGFVLDGIHYQPSRRELEIIEESKAISQDLDPDDIERLSDIIFKLNKLRYEVGKYTMTYYKKIVDQKLGQAYFYRGKIYHLKKNYLKAIFDFARVKDLFEFKLDSRNTPPYKNYYNLLLADEGLEAKCRLAEIYQILGNVKTALCEALECSVDSGDVENFGVKIEDALKKRIKGEFVKLLEMPLVINVASLAQKKRDKSLGYFGCDWNLLKLKKVLDLNRRACSFGETACHSATLWDNKIYILGGTSLMSKYGPKPRNIFWVLNLKSKEMVELAAPKKVVCRESHSCVAYKGCLYVYGGGYPFTFKMNKEDNKVTWKYCIAQNKWTALKTKGDSPITTGHGACVLSGKMFIFGGECVNGVKYGSQCKKKACIGCDLSVDTDFTDLYVLDLESLEWSKVSGTGGINPKLLGENTIPEGRQYPLMWPDEEKQRLFVLSGAGQRAKIARDDHIDSSSYVDSNFHFKDFWQYSVSNGEWTKLNLNGNVPVARSESQAAAVKGGAIIFGGYTIASKTIINGTSQYLQDSFEFCYDNMAFRQIYTEHQPGPRAMLGLVADPNKREKVYLIGGRGTIGGLSGEDNVRKSIVYGDIWQLDLEEGEAPGVNVDEDRDQIFCEVCDLSSSNTKLYHCSSCLNPSIRYCSKKCITTDWPNHKKKCLLEKEDNKKKQKQREEVPKD